MNVQIRKFFDMIDFGSSEPPKPIFAPFVGRALDCVLRELFYIARGDKKADTPSDSTVKNFEIYFAEAMESIKIGIAKELQSLQMASLQKEYGVRLACFLIQRFTVDGYINNKDLKLYISAPLAIWLRKPTEDLYMVEIFAFMLEFNLQLGDETARSIIQRS